MLKSERFIPGFHRRPVASTTDSLALCRCFGALSRCPQHEPYGYTIISAKHRGERKAEVA